MVKWISPKVGRSVCFDGVLRRRLLHSGRLGFTLLFIALFVGAPVAALGGPVAPVMAAAGQPSDQPGHVDVLFIGAHPDDEAGTLATFGQWNEYSHVKVGVITITRGEGGGNAAGPEEGPALGIIREAEERRAVGLAGISNIFYLDKVDFYYTVSAPLTDEAWNHQATLEKVVRVLRETRPSVIVTMNPSPTPGNHGNHQDAARLAIEAFYAAADSSMFPEQITQEGLQPWRVSKIFIGGAAGTAVPVSSTTPSPTTAPGQFCAATFAPAEPTDDIFGVWSGQYSARYGTSWAQVERNAQRMYLTQGWGAFPPTVSSDPTQLRCERFTLVDSRVPFTTGNTSPTAMLEGALQPAAGGLPLGTEFYLTTDQFDVVGGQPFTVTAHARASAAGTLHNASVALQLPAGWTATGGGTLGDLTNDHESTVSFTVTPPASAATNTRARLGATLSTEGMTGTTDRAVEVVPDVRGTLQPLPQVAQFRVWIQQAGVPQLDKLIKPVLTLGTGLTRSVRIDLTNFSDATQSGAVTLQLPAGFSSDSATKTYSGLAPHATSAVTFTVTNTDTTLKTSNGGDPNSSGDYNFTITTTSTVTSGMQQAAFELVPVTAIPQAQTAPTLDAVASPGEYPGPSLDLSRIWEGQLCSSPQDCSGSAKVSWYDDTLYFIVHVQDDILGTVLPPSDCKRHWRTDSVEIAIDPQGNSENTSTTFKTGILPITDDPAHGNPPCWERDADNHQGPGLETAPGMVVTSTVTSPYTGYTIEAKIPMADLPAAINPQHMGLNIFIYDSDTQDKTGQSRLGWSTWGGVQGDPYRWGQATLTGYMPPVGRSATPSAPIIPNTAAQSVDSPQSILQSANNGIPLAGDPAAPADDTVQIASGPTLSGHTLTVGLKATGVGTAHVFVWTGASSVVTDTIPLQAGPAQTLSWQLDDAAVAAVKGGATLLVGFETPNEEMASLAKAVTVIPSGGPTATPELGSGELLATGLIPLIALGVYRRRRRHSAARS